MPAVFINQVNIVWPKGHIKHTSGSKEAQISCAAYRSYRETFYLYKDSSMNFYQGNNKLCADNGPHRLWDTMYKTI